MSAQRDGGPAFPRVVQRFNDSFENLDGMSLRDWFAGQVAGSVLVAVANNPPASRGPGYEHLSGEEAIAVQAYAIADAMLKARASLEALREAV